MSARPDTNRKARKTVAVDFDGVLHRYSRGWQDGTIYDEPVEGAKESLEQLREQYNIVVFTARDDLLPVKQWLHRHGMLGLVREVTNQKPMAWVYIDDRGLRFEGRWGETLEIVEELAQQDRWTVLEQAEEAR